MDLHERHLNLITGGSPVSVGVEDVEGLSGDVERWEVASDVGDLYLLLSLAERVVDPASQLIEPQVRRSACALDEMGGPGGLTIRVLLAEESDAVTID